MGRKIARKCRRAGRYIAHEVWVSLQVTGAMWYPAGQSMPATLADIRAGDQAWHAAHGRGATAARMAARAHKTDMRQLRRARRRAAGRDTYASGE